ncbi:hypothetical protein GCM10023232_01470 [Sphingosinicella ginsenosidimutans]|uniref:ThuA domain-containing protein n=1 Tax=Allosphingosinicella ginsenosidimutans TaxID=1176539 RepID=A0A5C6TWE1_9SPHN|nr:ThuA domain-containing protein [Sphingosinicella ginsenosidimutans]TXC64048.1 ThuA domain-containing protein [Sphingosinicella ginsenosidimutans]
MPRIDYSTPLRVLVSVRGHGFDRTAFDRLFSDMDGIEATMVDQPASAQLMNPEAMADYKALVLYDMPGIDFGGPGKPSAVEPPPWLRDRLASLLKAGKGVVALHHALAGWPAWPEYGEWLGGRFLYRPGVVRGRPVADSGYRHDIGHEVTVLADHPVVAGLPPRFRLRDELYLAEIFDDTLIPLLRSDYAFTAANFWSSAAAMDGRMFDNSGWSHPDGSGLVGWVKRALASPLVYLQPGDGPTAYDDPHVRRLVENAIRWVTSPAALAWARSGAG